MPNVSDILDKKGTDVRCIDPGQSVINAARQMGGAGIGALVVTEGGNGKIPGKVIGIISERDIIAGIAGHGEGILNNPVVELMTSAVASCRRDENITIAMEKMVEGKFRHLPVIEDDELKGIISISDIVQFRINDLIKIIRA